MPIEHISRLIGHKSTTVTKKVYRQQTRPAMDEGATAMDRIFPALIEEPPSGSRARTLRRSPKPIRPSHCQKSDSGSRPAERSIAFRGSDDRESVGTPLRAE